MFLENKREEINNIDANIIELIIKRRYLSDEIIRFKQLNNLNIYDRDREKFIIESLKREYSSRLDPIEIEKLFTEILFFSKQTP